ncbi:MAG: AgmX/PglI C-terminal domain-containing protein [Myxococcaceae bacterium]
MPAIIDVDSKGQVQSVRLGLFEATGVGVCVEHHLRGLTVPAPPASSGTGLIVEMPVSRASQEAPMVDPTVLGSLSTDAVRRVLDEHRQQIRYCYEMLLNRFNRLSGAVTVKFVVGASGAVASAAVKQSTVNNLELDDCVIGRVKSWVFPMPRGGGVAIVTHRFVFGEQR